MVLSNNDGCVIARSNEAKVFVPMGAVAFKYKAVFEKHHVIVRSSNYALYGDLSARVMNVLATFTPSIEVYSIDEAFLHFKGFDHYDMQNYGFAMKSKIQQYIGIPVSVGFAPTKTLAKVANRIAKKFSKETQGVYRIDNEKKRIKALRWLKIADVWGVGKKTSQKLLNIQVKTAYDYTQLPHQYVQKQFGIVGLRIQKELLGLSCIPLEKVHTKKAIATTRSFKNDIVSYDDLRERIATFAANCATKLRKQKSHANMIQLFIHTNGFRKKEQQYYKTINIKLPYATNSSITLVKYATKALKAIYKKGYRYKKAGVIVMGLTPEAHKQYDLFEDEAVNHQKIMQVMDHINSNLGVTKVKLASQNIGRTWLMRQEKLSPRYTSNWNELLEVY